MVKVEVHLSDLDDFDAMDSAYREFFSDNAYPARTTTESPHLFGGSKVEITCQVRR
jgi:2-iminobutanoate/2-iminopropanoate deaminase